MIQGKIVDINVYYRKGGVDWEKLCANFNAVIISAGVGTWRSGLLQEQVDGAVAHNIPYFTYFIPDYRDGSLSAQADFYLQGYGVREAAFCVDLEAPQNGYRPVTASEALQVIERLEDRVGKSPILYTNPSLLTTTYATLPYPENYWWWIAQYPYQYPLIKYKAYAPFLEKYAANVPYALRAHRIANKILLWQFTDKGPAQELCASEYTLDPTYPTGIKECDLNVTTVELVQYFSIIGGTPPPPPPAPGCEFQVIADVVNVRSGPGTTYSIVGALYKNDVGSVEETAGSDVWYRIGEGRWIASYVNGKHYAKFV